MRSMTDEGFSTYAYLEAAGALTRRASRATLSRQRYGIHTSPVALSSDF